MTVDRSPLKQSEKRKYTEEWNAAFPALYAPKTMEMYQLIGPFLVMFWFRQGSNKYWFWPVFAISSSESEFCGLIWDKEFPSISRGDTEEERKQIIESAKAFVPFPLGQDLSYDVFEKFLLDSFDGKIEWGSPWLTYHQFGMMVEFYSYCGKSQEEIYDSLVVLREKYRKRVNTNCSPNDDVLELAMKQYCSQAERQQRVDKELEKQKLQDCPRYKILY